MPVVILIKLEFSASVGLVNKESLTMHGHKIVKKDSTSMGNFCTNTGPVAYV